MINIQADGVENKHTNQQTMCMWVFLNIDEFLTGTPFSLKFRHQFYYFIIMRVKII